MPDLDDREASARFLIRDRDSKYTSPFDEVFKAEGARVILTPIRAPKANAVAERFVGTVRRECLDWVMVRGRRHLDRVLRVYSRHYNAERPHRGIELRAPERVVPAEPVDSAPEIRRRDVLGGLIHEYEALAA